MANISLNAESLLEAAKKIEDAANRIDGAIGRIDSIMSDVDAVWSDQNSKKYLARYAELKEEFPAFKEAAHNYSAFLYAVVEAYRKEFVEPTSSSVN
jgi:uncharacterized protein YukE